MRRVRRLAAGRALCPRRSPVGGRALLGGLLSRDRARGRGGCAGRSGDGAWSQASLVIILGSVFVTPHGGPPGHWRLAHAAPAPTPPPRPLGPAASAARLVRSRVASDGDQLPGVAGAGRLDSSAVGAGAAHAARRFAGVRRRATGRASGGVPQRPLRRRSRRRDLGRAGPRRPRRRRRLRAEERQPGSRRRVRPPRPPGRHGVHAVLPPGRDPERPRTRHARQERRRHRPARRHRREGVGAAPSLRHLGAAVQGRAGALPRSGAAHRAVAGARPRRRRRGGPGHHAGAAGDAARLDAAVVGGGEETKGGPARQAERRRSSRRRRGR